MLAITQLVLFACFHLGGGMDNKEEQGNLLPQRRTNLNSVLEDAALLRGIIDDMPNSFYVTDMEGHLVWWNRALRESLGYSDEELVAMGPSDFIPEEDIPVLMAALAEVTDGRQVSVEGSYLAKGGRRLRCVNTAALLRDGDGDPLGICGVVVDTTERDRGPKDRELWSQVLLNTLPQKVFVKDMDLRFIFANRNFSADFELSDELIGKTVYDFYSRELADGYTTDDRQVLQSGETMEVEEAYTQGGEEFRVHMVKTPLRDGDGNITGLLGIFWDITERKRLEDKLQDASEYAQNIVSTVREPLVVLDDKFRVISANRSFYSTFQVTPEMSENILLFDLGNGQWEIPKLRELLEKVLPKSTTIEDFEVEHDFPTIGRKTMLMNARRIQSGTGATQMILLAIEDITERKAGEEKVSLLNTELRDASEYAQNIVSTVREPLVVLDDKFRVISANRSFYSTFQVTPEMSEHTLLFDLGNGQWEIPRLRELLVEVLPKSTSIEDFEVEHDFPTIGQKTMLINARRIQSETGATQMILLAIEDITERKRVEDKLRDASEYAQNIVSTVREPLVVLDDKFRVISANRSFYSTFQVTPEMSEHTLLFDLGNGQWEIPRLRELLEEVLPKSTTIEDFEVEHDFPTIGRKRMLINARRIQSETGVTQMILA